MTTMMVAAELPHRVGVSVECSNADPDGPKTRFCGLIGLRPSVDTDGDIVLDQPRVVDNGVVEGGADTHFQIYCPLSSSCFRPSSMAMTYNSQKRAR